MLKDELQKILDLHKRWLDNDPEGERAYLQDADLQGADLQGADLRGADLQGAYLQGADLQGADLQDADLQGAYLRGADLQGAYLQGAYLRGAYLRGADLQGAYLQGADLRGADLRGANLDFSAWPLYCGSLHVAIDERLARQLAYHVFAVASAWLNPTPEQIDFANGFHRIGEVPPLEGGSHVDSASLGK